MTPTEAIDHLSKYGVPDHAASKINSALLAVARAAAAMSKHEADIMACKSDRESYRVCIDRIDASLTALAASVEGSAAVKEPRPARSGSGSQQ